jgi:hypothetical protein
MAIGISLSLMQQLRFIHLQRQTFELVEGVLGGIDLKVQLIQTEWVTFGVTQVGRHVELLVYGEIQLADFPVPRTQISHRKGALLGAHEASQVNNGRLGSRRNQGGATPHHETHVIILNHTTE